MTTPTRVRLAIEALEEALAETAAEITVRQRLANNGRNPENHNEGISVGSPIHLCEMLLATIDKARTAASLLRTPEVNQNQFLSAAGSESGQHGCSKGGEADDPLLRRGLATTNSQPEAAPEELPYRELLEQALGHVSKSYKLHDRIKAALAPAPGGDTK